MSMLALIASPGKIRALKIGLVRHLNVVISVIIFQKMDATLVNDRYDGTEARFSR